MAYNLNAKVHVLKNGYERSTDDFGNRTITINGKTKTSKHEGIDLISSKYGTDYIIAFADGTVTDIRNSVKGYSESLSAGNYVVIKHNSTYTSVYYHLKKDSLKVKVGDKVKKGQVIAFMGTTGWSSGNHLHFGIKKSGTCIDPKPFLLGTKTISTGGTTKYTTGEYITLDIMKVRKSVWGTQKKVKDLSADGRKHATSTNLNALACYKKGTQFTALQIINHTDSTVWAKTPSGYICIKDKTTTYCKKK